MAGSYTDSATNNSRAAYWKNGVMTLLNGSYATGIFVNDTDIYIVGQNYSVGPRNQITYSGWYWKNGMNISLASAYKNSGISPIFNGVYVANGNVYIAGTDNLHATVWKNGIPITLDTSSSSQGSWANSVFVVGTDVYVAGTIGKQTSCCAMHVATLWKNGVPQTLGLGYSEAISVFVSGKDVYVGGYDDANPNGPGSLNTAAYWINGMEVKVDQSGLSSRVSNIFVDGSDIYALGSIDGTSGYGKYWKNGTSISYEGLSSNAAFASSLYVINGELFMSGSSLQSNSSNIRSVTYWHNKARIVLPINGYANAIFVK
jgi:hypothetical protein